MQTPETTPIKGLTRAGETVWYTGRAGLTGTSTSWLSFDRAEAFLLSVEGARRKAADLNRMTDIHGIHFIAVVGDEPLVQIPSNAKLIDHNGNGRVFCDGRKHYLLPHQHGTPVRIDGDCYGGRDCEGDGIAWVRGKQAVAPKNANGPLLAELKNLLEDVKALPEIIRRGAVLVGDWEIVDDMEQRIKNAIKLAEARRPYR